MALVRIRHGGGNYPADPSLPTVSIGRQVGFITIPEIMATRGRFGHNGGWSTWNFTRGTATWNGTNVTVPVVAGTVLKDGQDSRAGISPPSQDSVGEEPPRLPSETIDGIIGLQGSRLVATGGPYTIAYTTADAVVLHAGVGNVAAAINGGTTAMQIVEVIDIEDSGRVSHSIASGMIKTYLDLGILRVIPTVSLVDLNAGDLTITGINLLSTLPATTSVIITGVGAETLVIDAAFIVANPTTTITNTQIFIPAAALAGPAAPGSFVTVTADGEGSGVRVAVT